MWGFFTITALQLAPCSCQGLATLQRWPPLTRGKTVTPGEPETMGHGQGKLTLPVIGMGNNSTDQWERPRQGSSETNGSVFRHSLLPQQPQLHLGLGPFPSHCWQVLCWARPPPGSPAANLIGGNRNCGLSTHGNGELWSTILDLMSKRVWYTQTVRLSLTSRKTSNKTHSTDKTEWGEQAVAKPNTGAIMPSWWD